jgi:hypothetical protein
MSDPRRQILLDIRRGLLGLHKALIVAEQVTYERINGRVDSTGKLLQLVLDELLEDDDDVTDVEVEHFLAEVRALIRPSEEGDGFERSYYEALQREPDVIFAHVEVKKLLTRIAA